MFTPKNKKKFSDNFLLVQSMTNYPVHYNPHKTSTDSNYIYNNLLIKNIKNRNYISEYSKQKYKNKISLLKKLQREKIDILINNVFDKINYNIRDYNYKDTNKNLIKLKPISNVLRESIKDDLIYKYNNILGNKNPFPKSQPKVNKELLWSKKILEQKKLLNYRRIYSIKYIKLNNKSKFKIQNTKNSYNMVNNIFGNNNKRNNSNITFYKISSKKFYSSEK